MRTYILVITLCVSATGYAVWSHYHNAARALVEAAAQKSKKRIAVLSFSSETGKKDRTSAIVTERLSSQIAAQGEVELIERDKLDAILKEQGLQSRGIVDSKTASSVGEVLGVDAVVTGSVIDLGNGMVELNARLVETQSAKVLHAVNQKVKKDWEDTSMWAEFDSLGDDLVPPPPILPEGYFGTADTRPCANGKQREMQDLAIEIKARKTALSLKNGEIDIRKLASNPGSDIADKALRSKFYAGIKNWYRKPAITPLTGQEEAFLKTAEPLLRNLSDDCP